MAKTPPKTAEGAARTTVKSIEAAEEYILMQGAVINSANLLQDAFFGLFRAAISLERQKAAASGGTKRFHHHALAIWHAVQSDSAQRDIAIAAISSIPGKLKLSPALRRLNWTIKILRLLTRGRNDLAHNPIVFYVVKREPTPEWLPMIGGQGVRAPARRRFKLIQGTRLWRDIADDLFSIAQYVEAINVQIQRLDILARDPTFRIQISWPRRPRLRSLPRVEEIEKELNRGDGKSKRDGRRRLSRKKL
jgi:hypothetical protein